jgi:hypothetical protein
LKRHCSSEGKELPMNERSVLVPGVPTVLESAAAAYTTHTPNE